jgi:hypothetical protein
MTAASRPQVVLDRRQLTGVRALVEGEEARAASHACTCRPLEVGPISG